MPRGKDLKNEMAAIDEAADPTQTVSVTFQTARANRDKLERFARANGQTYVKPHNTGVQGNVSWAVNEALEHFFATQDAYLARKAEQLAKALESS